MIRKSCRIFGESSASTEFNPGIGKKGVPPKSSNGVTTFFMAPSTSTVRKVHDKNTTTTTFNSPFKNYGAISPGLNDVSYHSIAIYEKIDCSASNMVV